MDRRSRSIESPRRHRNGSATVGCGPRREYLRHSRSRSRSRNRSRERDYRRRSRSRERVLHRRAGSAEKDLYRDIIDADYQEEEYYHHGNHRSGSARINDDDFDEREREHIWAERTRDKAREMREFEREYRDHERDNRDRREHRGHSRHSRRHNSQEREREYEDHSDESDDSYQRYSNKTPTSTLIAFGLQPNITEADLTSALIQYGLAATSIRLIRKVSTGASRGFAFVEFNTVDEAVHWMELTQGTVVLSDQSRVHLQYSHSKYSTKSIAQSDWYCGKCGIFNFKRRDSCFKCFASREESRKGGEGCDEISNILTKKIMLRNLDVLTNEEGVLTAMQQHVPDLAKQITKILISRDPLTQTSRGICYLHFETLVDSMNVHNALSGLEPPLQIENRDVIISYCIDHENREIVPKSTTNDVSAASITAGPLTSAEMAANSTASPLAVATQYTLADVPRLAEYSAAMYATTPEEHAHYQKYYTEYYLGEMTKGQHANLPTKSQINDSSANSAAAVALSAIQRKQKKMSGIETTATQAAAAAAAAAAAVKAALSAHAIVTPKGNDGKVYPSPDVSLYQYDETSGYYYDPATGLYYDAHSQYYYNNETGAYLYWDQRKSTYVLATPAAAAATVQDVVKSESSEDTSKATAAATAVVEEDSKKESKKEGKHDKVKVAKKIVKDMEKWAKQLNQKKDYTVVATPQPLLPSKGDDYSSASSKSATQTVTSSGYADVCFSILEKKERPKLTDYLATSKVERQNKLVSSYGSDSDEEHPVPGPSKPGQSAQSAGEATERDYVDLQKLTCLLCKRAFQSLEILNKHLKMSNLHKENLQKFNLGRAAANANTDSDGQGSSLSYRDRAKERRLKYGEFDPPPNRSRERFEKEIKNLTAASRKNETLAPAMPIGSNNVGNRLLQKMGWSEGQGLGRKNQGRTNIIEADARTTTAGLGNRSGGIPAGDDYKTYIKRMMKTRYESV